MRTYSILLTGLLILSFSTAWAGEYYVDIQNGSNQTGDGSQLNPWRNITFAHAQIAGTGHTLHVAPGIYNTAQDAGGIGEVFPIQMETGVSIVGDQGASVTIIDAQTTAKVFQATSISAGTILQGLTIKNGRATDTGGGVWMSSSSMTIQDCIIESNTVTSTSSVYGGGIYISGGSPTITGCTLQNNTTSSTGYSSTGYSYGGGIYASGATPTLSDNTITGNSSTAYYAYGGGIYLTSCSSGSIQGNTIKANVASTIGSSSYPANGGGIYMTGSTVNIDHNVIDSNTLGGVGTRTGGGIYLTGGTYTISRNWILNNQNQGFYVASGATTIKDNIFARNAVGVYLNASSTVINNTFANNTTTGLECNSSADATARNNVFSGNLTYAMYEGNVNTDITADSNLFYNNTSGLCYDEGQTAITTVAQLNLIAGNSNNIAGNPLFLNEASDDYRLTSTSPAKNVGSSTSAPTDDVDGEPRPNESVHDIGADEYYDPHAADTNTNYVIENFEMLRWVDDWADGLITQGQLDELRAIWSCLDGYKSDGAGGFTCR